MTSIDEAIAMMHEWADYECYNEEQIQASEAFNKIAEWFEELKEYIEIGTVEECRNSVLDIQKAYNKAIDDFVKFANTMPTVEEEDGTIRPMWLEEMAEKLKAGEKNENYNKEEI